MLCASCASGRQHQFVAEINLHFPGLKNLDKPSVFVFPNIAVCLNCGFAQFTVPNTELALLAEGVRTSLPSSRKKDVGPGHLRSRDCA
jgi:hypothetical protein